MTTTNQTKKESIMNQTNQFTRLNYEEWIKDQGKRVYKAINNYQTALSIMDEFADYSDGTKYHGTDEYNGYWEAANNKENLWRIAESEKRTLDEMESRYKKLGYI